MIQIEDKKIGAGYPCFIIAEAGSNHNRDFSQARKLIEAAKDAGADAIKFQHYNAERMYPKTSSSVDYLKKLGIEKNIYDLIKDVQIPSEWTADLADYCRKQEIIFLSTPFSEEDTDIIDPYVPAFKVASYELTHIPLIRYIARKQKPLIVSTGGAKDIEEIKETVEIVKNAGNDQICLMQCTAKYPAPIETINARAIVSLKKEFQVPVGLSDHSRHPLYGAAAAIAAGADLYEKHFTLSRQMKGPDHSFALEPGELTECVSLIRNMEKALGSSKKEIQDVEKELVNYRRSVYTIKEVRKGEIFTKENTRILRRPGVEEQGIAPAAYENVLGKTAQKDLSSFSLLRKEDVG